MYNTHFITKLTKVISNPAEVSADSPASPGMNMLSGLSSFNYFHTLAQYSIDPTKTGADLRAFLEEHKILFDNFDYVQSASNKNLEAVMHTIASNVEVEDEGIFWKF